MKKVFIGIIIVILIGIGVWFGVYKKKEPTPVVTSFAECVQAGYMILGDNPRQCKTPDGRIYAEEKKELVTYNNASADMIVVDVPYPGAVTGKTFSVIGRARGSWYFEASFPIQVLDKDGKVLVATPAQAQGDWMTTNFVPFKVDISVPNTYIGPATLVLKKDNPSGLSQNEASISFPITIEY